MKKLKISIKIALMLILVATTFSTVEVLARSGSANISGHNITYVELNLDENWTIRMFDAPSLFDGRTTATLTEFHNATEQYHGNTVLLFPAVFFHTGGSNEPINPFRGPVRFDHYSRLSIGGQFTHNPETHQASFGAFPHLIADYERLDQSRWDSVTPAGTYGRARRAFMGQRSDGTLIVANVASANIPELQDMAQGLYLRYATNIDGGASASIMLNGTYITRPGRQLATVLLITGDFSEDGELPATAYPPTDAITVTINNTPVNFTDQAPTIVDGRTLVPVRGVFEALGFGVSWNEQARQVTLTRANDTVVITVDSATFTANGANRTLDVPAQIIGGRTMLPIRAVLESVGYDLGWNEATRTVVISTN